MLKDVTTAESSAERTEVSRGHSNRKMKGRINRSLKYDPEEGRTLSVENIDSCLQKNSAERKGYVRAHRSFNRIWKERDSAEPDMLGKILKKDNLNRAFKRVKANKGTLKLKVNREKSRTVSVFAISNFKYLGFCFGKNGKGIYIRVHPKSWKKVKDKLRGLTSRSHCGG